MIIMTSWTRDVTPLLSCLCLLVTCLQSRNVDTIHGNRVQTPSHPYLGTIRQKMPEKGQQKIPQKKGCSNKSPKKDHF